MMTRLVILTLKGSLCGTQHFGSTWRASVRYPLKKPIEDKKQMHSFEEMANLIESKIGKIYRVHRSAEHFDQQYVQTRKAIKTRFKIRIERTRMALALLHTVAWSAG